MEFGIRRVGGIMSGELITELASTGALALVNAVATDAWQTARAGFTRLLGRGEAERERLVATRIDEAATQLEQVGADDQERVREALLLVWRTRFADLLEERPDAIGELQALVERLRAALADAPSPSVAAVGTGSVFSANTGGLNITNTGTVGNITLHGEPRRHDA
ncbi:hypothetical protein ACFWAR_04675 [Streptomyces sp. NPDC059917]|uniref:hypothetical protein n=1 Tax=Streptomyces sp. NPDC059917 TaxID=3347002 RepID=UPI00365DAF3A